MIFDEEIEKAGDSDEIEIHTRINDSVAAMIDGYATYFRTRNSFIESAFRYYLVEFSAKYKAMSAEMSDRLVEQAGSSRKEAINALFRMGPYYAITGRNTVQICMKISKQFAIELRMVDDLTWALPSTIEFINFCCCFFDQSGLHKGKVLDSKSLLAE